MVEQPGKKLNDITFEDIRISLGEDANLRAAVLHLLAEQYGDELVSFVKAVPRPAGSPGEGRRKG